MKKLLFYFVPLSSLICFLICLLSIDNVSESYTWAVLYPLIYGVLFLLVWPYVTDKTRSGRITAGVFLLIQWLRAVLLPPLGIVSGQFSIDANLVDAASASTASALFLYELIVSFVAVYLILRFSKRSAPVQDSAPMELSGHRFVYVAFVLFALALYFWKGQGMYSFFLLNSSESRAEMLESNVGQILSAVINFGLTFAIVLLLYHCYQKYTATGLTRYVYFALLVALLRVCLISSSSDGRLAILYPTGAFLLLLPKLFQKHSRMIIRCILVAGIAVISMMTVYKVFYAFLYDSYTEALQNGLADFGAKEAATQVDVYFYGAQTIARNLYVSEQINLSISNVITDLLRNTFGIHYLVKDTAQSTVELYNLYIYGGRASAGHLYSSLAYGYTYFGAVLAPLATVFNIWFAAFLEKFLRKAKHMDTFYILSIVYVRMAYTMFSCFPMGWNNASRNLILGFMIIGGASLLKHKWGGRMQMHTLRSI